MGFTPLKLCHSVMPSAQRSRSALGRVPLADEISAIGLLKNRSKKRKPVVENESDNYVDSRSSRKILKIAQDLAEEEEKATDKIRLIPNSAFTIESRFLDTENDEPEDDEDAEVWEDEDHEEIAEVVSTLLLGV